jgi:hypothetical protein
MKSTANPYAYGALAAEQLVKSWGLVLPIDPFAIAGEFKITVAAKPKSHPGVSGMLVRVANEFAIAAVRVTGNLFDSELRVASVRDGTIGCGC